MAKKKILFIGYPKCSTCQKAEKFLRTWHAQSGLPLKRFFNTSGMLYRELGLKDKLPAMTEEEQYAVLASDGMLVKRPLLIAGDHVLVGFREKEWADCMVK